MRKILIPILLIFCIFLIPNSIIAKETNTETLNKNTPFKDFEKIQERTLTKLVEKYNAVEGISTITDKKGNIISTYKIIKN